MPTKRATQAVRVPENVGPTVTVSVAGGEPYTYDVSGDRVTIGDDAPRMGEMSALETALVVIPGAERIGDEPEPTVDGTQVVDAPDVAPGARTRARREEA